MMYGYGVALGIESLLHGSAMRESFKNVLVPVNYWRTLEFQLVMNELRAVSTDRILDIGSPKLLSFYLADRIGAEVYSTDIEDYFLRNYEAYASVRRIPPERFHPMVADGRHLPFPDNHFTKIFSISVVEHIPEEGDSACLAEIGRVLAPGGVCAITVPFAPVRRDEFKRDADFYWAGNSKPGEDGNLGTFFQRRYDEAGLHSRLIAPSGLQLDRLLYLGDAVKVSNSKELSEYFHPLLGPLHPVLSHLLHAAPSTSWQDMVNPLGALIVLRKPNTGH
jgi:SAM-dependent methyltransferase